MTLMSEFATTFSILPTICIAIGSYWLVVAVVKDIINDYCVLNEKVLDPHVDEMKEIFNKVVQDISDVKQLSYHVQSVIIDFIQ